MSPIELERRIVQLPPRVRASIQPFGSAMAARQFVFQSAHDKIVRVFAVTGDVIEVVITLSGAMQMAPFFSEEFVTVQPGEIAPARCEYLDEIPANLRAMYEAGEHPSDEPPGFTEMYYAAWKRLGGKVAKKTDTVPQSVCKREAMKAIDVVTMGMHGGAGTGTVECDESGRSIKVNLELFRPGSPDVVVQRQPSPATTKDIVKSLAYRLEWADECADFLGEVVATLTLPSNAGKFGLSQFDDYVANLAQRYAKLTAKRPQ